MYASFSNGGSGKGRSNYNNAVLASALMNRLENPPIDPEAAQYSSSLPGYLQTLSQQQAQNDFVAQGYDPTLRAMQDASPQSVIQGTQTNKKATDPLAQLLASFPKNGNSVESQQLAALANQLFGQPVSPAQFDPSANIAAAIAGINQQYGGAIGGLKKADKNAKAEANYGSAQTQKLYAALRRSMMNDAKTEGKAGKNLAKQLQQIGNQTAGAAQQDAQQQLNQNAAFAKGVGQPNILPALNAGIQNQANMQKNAALKAAQGDASDQVKLGGIYAHSARVGGQAASIEGTQRSADLYSQLQGFVQQNLSKIASLAGERSAAAAQARATISANAAKAYNSASSNNASNMWKAMLEIAQLSNQNNNDSVQNWATLQKIIQGQEGVNNDVQRTNLDTKKFNYQMTNPSGASNPLPKGIAAANQILDSQPASVQQAFKAIVNSGQATAASGNDLTNPNTAMQVIMNSGAANGLSASQIAALQAAIIREFGG